MSHTGACRLLLVCVVAACAAGCEGFQGALLPSVSSARGFPPFSLTSAKAHRRARSVPPLLRTTALWGSYKEFKTLNDAVSVGISGLLGLVAPRTTGGRTTTAVRLDSSPSGMPRIGRNAFKVSDTLQFLTAHGISVDDWGVGAAKTLGDLTAEVRKGECVLRDGKRQIYVVKVIITDGDCELVEARQISVSNGHVKERQRCLSEKLHPSDGSIRKAAYRGICEELGDIVGTSPQVRFVEASVCTAEEIGKSSSFPGLMTQYTLYSVQAEIEGLTREATSDSFITVEDGRVHQWEWKKSSPSDVKGKSTSAASHN